ncbi:MAG: FMN-binding negative transcriptional regulator [Luteimonas sp.]
MYTPRAFVETDLAQLDALLACYPFVTLVTVTGDAEPAVTHLPVLYQREGDRVLVEGHWAKPNPQATQSGKALMIVQGPHAYVSPSWYPDKEAESRVPTWNYAVAHLHGTLACYHDEAGLSDLVARMSDHFEARAGSDWAFEPERDDHRLQLRGIIGFRFVPQRIEIKLKLNQNHPEANRRAVAVGLRGQHDANADAIADLMQARDA